jgi:hypothetical protein
VQHNLAQGIRFHRFADMRIHAGGQTGIAILVEGIGGQGKRGTG